MTKYTNTITNLITITQTNLPTLTNWVTQTNSITAANDPALWAMWVSPIIALVAIIVSGWLIRRQIAIMQKQTEISEKQVEISKLQNRDAKINELMSIFIDINRQYNESLFRICELRNTEHPAMSLYDPHPKEVIPYYFNLSLFLNLACRIYYQQEDNIRDQIRENFKNIFDKDIIQFFEASDESVHISEYETLNKYFSLVNIESLKRYHKEDIPASKGHRP